LLRPLITAGGGFLLAVLWFDLMFDVQVLRSPADEAAAIESIAAYYRRVTTAARPMNRFVALAMLVTLGALVAEVVGDDVSNTIAVASLILAAVPIGLAGTRTVPRAIRLGQQQDAPEWQSRAARVILREHLTCLAFVVVLLVVQVGIA
jgi:hypothetical protein